MKSTTPNMPMLADSYTMTQLVHWLAGEYELTLSAAKEGMQVSQSIGNIWNQAAALTLSAVAHLEQADFGQAREIIAYIADHTGSANLSASFLALPEVRAVLNSS